MGRPLGPARLLLHRHLAWSLRLADGSPNGPSEKNRELDLADARWDITAEMARRVRFTSYDRWLRRGLVELFKLPDQKLTERSWK